jgi:hypothetical protein
VVSTKSAPEHITLNLSFWHPVRSASDIVHSDASGVRNIDALYFKLRWNRYGFHKKLAATHCVKIVFLHLV